MQQAIKRTSEIPLLPMAAFGIGLALTALAKGFLTGSLGALVFAVAVIAFGAGLLMVCSVIYTKYQLESEHTRVIPAGTVITIAAAIQGFMPFSWVEPLVSLLLMGALIYLVFPIFRSGLMKRDVPASEMNNVAPPMKAKARRFFYALLKTVVAFLVLVFLLSVGFVGYANWVQQNAATENVQPGSEPPISSQ